MLTNNQFSSKYLKETEVPLILHSQQFSYARRNTQHETNRMPKNPVRSLLFVKRERGVVHRGKLFPSLFPTNDVSLAFPRPPSSQVARRAREHPSSNDPLGGRASRPAFSNWTMIMGIIKGEEKRYG